ncbi:MAG: VCBS repeat-containing protein [Saprospiraceae bacterium]|nr:VCBS repeat-containing protein [Saprospiraceae bacterium]
MRKILILAFLAFGFHAYTYSQVSFSDISGQSGANQIGLNYGVAIGDYNNDGLEDIFATRMEAGGNLYKNIGDENGGNPSFQNVTQAAGINPAPSAQFAIWGDVDNDGWLDLFIGARDEGNALYRNNHDGTFTEVTATAGVTTGGRVKSALFADVDMDGWLDIYVARLGWENILYRNNQDGTFTDITVQAGVTDASISMGAIFFDYDNDGDPDLYLTHDANVPNILYRNNGNADGTGVTFTNVSNLTGTNIAAMGMGVDVADINNDGWFDIYITNLGANTLLLNNGNPGGFGNYFWSTAEMAGVADLGMGWGCSFFDYDNDGWQDLYVANDSYFSPYPNLLYHNNANPSPSGVTYSIASQGTVLHSMEGGYGFGCFDMDNDGLLDIYLANYGGDVGNQLFKNEMNNSNNWLKIKAVGVESNKSGIGGKGCFENWQSQLNGRSERWQ